MTRIAMVMLVLVAAGCSSRSTDATEDPVKKDLQAVKGDWKIVSRVVDGKEASADELKDLIAHRDGEGKLTMKKGEAVVFEAVGKLDPTKNPKTFDSTQLSGPNKGKVALGIYKLEGDTMTVCIAEPGDDTRPTEFSSKPGSKWALVISQRIKP